MNHLGTVTLETERLLLRQFKLDDAQYVYDNWASNSEVTKYLMWQPHKSVKDSEEFMESLQKGYEQGKTYDWAIVLKESDQPIGSMGVVKLDEKVSLVHIGYCIGTKWWNQGITSEAFSKVIEFLFEQVGVNRIECRHDSNNPNSGKVMQKCGLNYEGTLRQSDWNNQGICDASWYAILRDDYVENCKVNK